MLLLIGPTLFTPQVFLFSISLFFVNKYHYFIEAYYTDATFKLSVEKLKPTTFLKLSVQNDSYINIDCVTESLCKSFAGGPSYGRNQPAV